MAEHTKAQIYMKLKGVDKEQAKKMRREFWLRFFDTGVVKTDLFRQEYVAKKLKEDGF